MSPAELLERSVCACFGTAVYSSLPPSGHGLSDVELAEARRDARYFAISNGIRAVLLVPLVYVFRGGPAIFELASTLGLLFHVVLVTVESYRASLLRRLPFEGHPSKPARQLEKPSLHPYFGPFAWEPSWLYRALGCELMRRFLLAYKSWARDEKSSRLGPNPEPSKSRASAFEAIRQSRQAESVHLAGVMFDGFILFGTLQLQGYWWVIPATGIFTELEIIFLQRLLRLRLRRLHLHNVCVSAAPDRIIERS